MALYREGDALLKRLILLMLLLAVALSAAACGPVSGTGDAEIRAGIDRLYEYYTARLKPIIDEFHKARENEQRKLDNIVNYTMESELCREFDRERPDKRL